MESLELNRDLGDGRAIAYLLEDIGCLELQVGDLERSLHLIGAASSLREKIGAPLTEHERGRLEELIQPVRSGLISDEQEQALAAGKAISMDQALSYALPETN